MKHALIDRKSIVDLLSPNSVGCELGVFEGEYAEILWKSGKFDKLYLVDVFCGRTANFGKEIEDASFLEQMVTEKFKQEKGISIVKSDSVNFLLDQPQDSLDFVYIDTLHTYDQTIKELNAAYSCVKPNGYICGHDYCKLFHGVIDAVQEFVAKHDLNYTITKNEEEFPSYVIYQHKN